MICARSARNRSGASSTRTGTSTTAGATRRSAPNTPRSRSGATNAFRTGTSDLPRDPGFSAPSNPEWSDEIDEIELVLPDHYVDDELTVDLGDRGVSIRSPGRGHTDNDLVAVVSDSGTVFAGDIVEESAPPSYGDDCFPLDWPATNARLLSWIEPGATVVPGHGDVIDRAFVAGQNNAIEQVAQTIRELHAAGVLEADTLATGEWAFPRERLAEAVRRGYAELSR